MPPKKQNQRPLREIMMEEMRRHIQLLQESANAQQAFFEVQRRRVDDNGSSSDSSFSRSSRSHRRQTQMSDIKAVIPNFEGKLQPDEFVD